MRWAVLCVAAVYFANHATAQQTLRTINFETNIGATVDVNLSNRGTAGTCRLRQPNGPEVDLATLNVVGVTVKPASKFVSCRVTIGPLTEALLGSWELIETSGQTTRTQPVTIAWADTSNPSAPARQRVLSGEQDYKVNLGGSVVANLRRETGMFTGCFITAPDGTTMPLAEDTDYPGVQWTSRSNSINICHVQLGPVDADMVGNWMMFGWFLHDGIRIEAQQPVAVHEEDGIEHLPVLEYLTHSGKSYDVSLNRTVNLATCVLIDPTGTEYTLTTASIIPGVTVYNADRYTICRVRIGPMEQSLIGEWTLVQENTDNTRRRQQVIFQWANPSNIEEESWFVVHDIPRQIFATTGTTTEIFIGRNQGFFEFCYITTPTGIHLPMYGRNYPGVNHVLSNRMSSCVVELGPLDADMLGDWTLHARHDVNGRSIEIAQTFHVAQDTGVRTLPRMRHFTNLGATIDINLNNTGVTSTCRLQAPNGIEYGITPGSTPLTGVTAFGSSRYVSCRVAIGPITENLIGEWVLIEQSTGQQRRQPVIIQFAHPAHPDREARQLIIAPEIVLPTDLDGIVEAEVSREMGTFQGCFLTIPDGTVIPIMWNTAYPGIRLGQPTRISSCPIEVGPVTADMVGRYTLSGMGHHVGFRTESQQSFTIIEDDGITNLPPLRMFTHRGGHVDINLEQTGSIAIGTCLLRNPAGQIFVLDSTFNLAGVTVHSSSKFVSCRVHIGPMSDYMLGDWTLMHQVPGQRERRVHVSVFWANPMDPSFSYQIITAPEQNVVGAFGDIVTVTTPWHPGIPISCVIIAPDGTVMPHSEGHDYPGIGWARSNSASSCTAFLGPLDDSMIGRWTLAARFDDNGLLLESQQSITLGRNTNNEFELPALEYVTNIGASVDLSLDNMRTPVQSCALLTPDGEYHELAEDVNIPGVTVHGPSKYVSCRVTIGPMTEQLLGTWTLVENAADGRHRRQTALFTWANPSNPDAVPRLMIASQLELRADTGEIHQVFISREDGFFEGCFITAPDGTVLPLFPHMHYPGIKHAGLNRLTACFVDLGPMDSEMVGTWILAARFNNAGSRVETQLPINLMLVDGTHIHLPIHELTYYGGYVDLNLNQTGVGGGCSLTTPDGQEYVLGTTSSIAGVAVHAASKFVACRVVIGPMTEALLGDWVITHLGSDNTERHQPMTISWENPADPSAQRQVTTQAQQAYEVRFGTIISTSIAREDGMYEGCFLTTPDGTVLPVLATNAYPGTIWAGVNRITACFVQIGPVDPEELGTWVLVAKTNNYGVRTELQIPIQITAIQNQALLTDNLPRREVFTSTGGFVDISLNETGRIAGSCSLRNPAGRTFLLQNTVMVPGVQVRNSNAFVSCTVRIGPMSQELLGTWTLIQQDTLTTERTQAVQISWAHPANPQDPPTLVRQAFEEIVVEEDTMFTLAAPRYFNDSFSEGCYITTPDFTTLPIFFDNRYPGITHAGANRHTICFVEIGPITAEMAGRWTLSSIVNRAGERIISDTPTRITISDGVVRLPALQHVAYEGHFIDLALNQTSHTGNCLLRIPSGHEYTLASAESLNGITVHEESKFVSCRVVIGPITETLIGDWVLIQQFTDPHLREQPATIAWANPDDTTAEVWDIRTESDVDLYGDYGATVSISIPRQSLNFLFEGCFLTTPDGTTLPIFSTNAYPGISHMGVNQVTACFVDLGPIDSEMEGTWVLAARFNDNGVRHEDRQPFNLAIGKDQELLTNNLPRREVFTSTGGFVDISLNETGSIAGSCSLRNPAGRTFLLQNTVMVPGVQVRNSNAFVSCTVRIGPMSQELLGTWTLIQQDTLTTERTQAVQISWAHPANPQDPPTLIRQPFEEIVVEEGTMFTLAAPRYFNDSFSEGCYITTPDFTTLPIFFDNRYPGITHAGANRHTICFVEIGPITAEMAGPWTLSSIVNRAGERIISDTPTRITISDGVVRLPAFQHVAFEGHFIDLALNQTGQTGNCLLRIPSGHEYTLATAESLAGITVYEESKFVSCRVVIGPITETSIGDWVLIQQFTDPHLREQPATIAWANPDDTTAEVWDIRTESDVDLYGDYGATVSISIPRQSLNFLFEGCFLTTPDGTTLPIFSTNAYPGISHMGVNQVTACFVDLGPIDSEMEGTWVLAARFNDNGVRHEDRQPFNLAIGSPPAAFNSTALIVSLTVIFGLVFVVVGVIAYKPTRAWTAQRWGQSRSWSTNRWHRMRSSMRSVSSRAPIVDHELESSRNF